MNYVHFSFAISSLHVKYESGDFPLLLLSPQQYYLMTTTNIDGVF